MIRTLRACFGVALLASAGLVLAVAPDARGDPAQEENEAVRQSIIQGIRDDVQRRTRPTKEVAKHNTNNPKSRRNRLIQSTKMPE